MRNAYDPRLTPAGCLLAAALVTASAGLAGAGLWGLLWLLIRIVRGG